MATFALLCCVITTIVYIAYGYVESFGIRVGTFKSVHPQSENNLFITLYWEQEILQCSLIPNVKEQWFRCYRNISQCDSQSMNPQYEMNLYISATDGLWISQVSVTTNSQTYLWDKFCSNLSLNFPYLSPAGNCTTSGWTGFTEWDGICLDGNYDCNYYSSLTLNLSSMGNEALTYLSSFVIILYELYIYIFIHHIYNFGVKTLISLVNSCVTRITRNY